MHGARNHVIYLLIFMGVVTSTANANPILETVIDGDTVVIHDNGERYKLRLRFIDAPELQQAAGKQAQRSLRQLCLGDRAATPEAATQIHVQLSGLDRYQRRLGDLYCDGINAAAHQVANGYAWVDTRYVEEATLLTIQSAAQQQGVGLWAQAQPTAPWLWRKQFGHIYHRPN